MTKIDKTVDKVLKQVFNITENERVLIITNNQKEVEKISKAFYEGVLRAKAFPTLIIQEVKTLLDFADKEVIANIETSPDIILSISYNKLGKDEKALKKPYLTEDGQKFTSVFNYLLDGVRKTRAAWTPGLTVDMFCRTANIDYKVLKERCKKLIDKFVNADYVTVTSPGGTNITVPVKNRTPFADDGDFSLPGLGGNIPAGEVYISPVVGGCNGVIVFDGSITLTSGDIIIKQPIKAKVENGFVSDLNIDESEDAKKLLECILNAENNSIESEKSGKLSSGEGIVYQKNARNIGELGIGLNPKAKITGNMLEDEKAFKTCHFAIGQNYDGDAPALIHLDGLVKNPTITIHYSNSSEQIILNNGMLVE